MSTSFVVIGDEQHRHSIVAQGASWEAAEFAKHTLGFIRCGSRPSQTSVTGLTPI